MNTESGCAGPPDSGRHQATRKGGNPTSPLLAFLPKLRYQICESEWPGTYRRGRAPGLPPGTEGLGRGLSRIAAASAERFIAGHFGIPAGRYMGKIKIEDLETINATKAKVHFGELLHQTSVEGKTFLISRQDKPISVILGYKKYVELISSGEKKS